MKTDFDLPSLSGLLPDRPIAIRNPGFADRFRMMFIAVILGLISVGIVVTVFPGLYRDYRIKLDPVEVTHASLASSRCTSKRMTVECEADIAYPTSQGTQIKPVSFSFLDISGDSYQTAIVAERGHRDNMTLSLAIDELWNRALCSLALTVLLGGVAILMGRRHFHLSATYKGVQHAAALEPIWAKVTMRSRKWGRDRITYAPITGRKARLAVVSLFRKDETPWMHFDAMQNETFVIAVRHPEAPLPVMLDEALVRLEMTVPETHAVQARREALFPEA
jgi:hypothetical protein